MTMPPGTRLGPYEILSALGTGGMGEVYRARDTKLNRDVAIKVLLPAVANDPDRLARFGREAQVLASLNHPNIAHIHGLEESDGVRALVMELVEGPTLADLIAARAGSAGPGLPVNEALLIARQVADALEAAHEHGVIHRDLKPANIKVRADGTVKVLDFGLAKAVDPATSSIANATMSPTLSIHATQAGLILGTAAYMSPEQAAGKPVDKRSDLWSFGVVLLEMLSGRQPFGGETISHVLAAVLKDEPDWTTLPANTPAPVRRLLRRCLQKDRKRRLDSAADARLEIDEALTGSPAEENAASVQSDAKPRPWLRLLPWAVAAVALAIAGTLASRGTDRDQTTPVYASIDAPPDFVLGDDDGLASLPTRTPMVFTPDGRSLIILATREGKRQLFLRPLDRPEARPIAGTEDARVPFVSPDGRWIGFFAANELRKVPIEGGTATTIAPLRAGLGPYGAAWSAGDVIVFGDDVSGRLMRVSASGGTPEAVTAPPPFSIERRRHVAPVFLPDGQRLLFSDVSMQDATDSRLMVQALDGGDARLVIAAASDGRLLPSGRLAFMRLGTLMTVAFDAARAEAAGDAVAALGGVMQSGLRGRVGAENTGAGMFAVSGLGTLAVIRGRLTGGEERLLVWVTQDGRSASAEPSSGAPVGGRLGSQISPDGSRGMVAIQTPLRRELWVADWARDVWTLCGDCDSATGFGIWSPDGQRLLIGRKDTLVAHPLDGSAPDQVLVREADRALMPMEWLADGRILYLSSPDQASQEIKFLEPGGSAGRTIVPLGIGSEADVSPDGRWLAYTSMQSGQNNVFVQAFPGPGARVQVSAGGGRNPAWSADGRTLYYLDITRPSEPGAIFFAVEITTTGVLRAATPREVLRRPDLQGCAPFRCYDLAADGKGFLLRDRGAARPESVSRMDLVLNWTDTLTQGP